LTSEERERQMKNKEELIKRLLASLSDEELDRLAQKAEREQARKEKQQAVGEALGLMNDYASKMPSAIVAFDFQYRGRVWKAKKDKQGNFSLQVTNKTDESRYWRQCKELGYSVQEMNNLLGVDKHTPYIDRLHALDEAVNTGRIKPKPKQKTS
jgi:hypothetical protein